MGKIGFAGGKVGMAVPVGGIIASELAVGSTVKLMEKGAAVEYLVIHQGLPGSMYDASCNGTWLLRKDLSETAQWTSSGTIPDYSTCTLHSYLNSTVLSRFDANLQNAIKQVKIPHAVPTSVYPYYTTYSGANGLSAKVFILGAYEVGWTTSTNSNLSVDGVCLSYFNGMSATDVKRIAYLNGVATTWLLRATYARGTNLIFTVNESGGCTQNSLHGTSTPYLGVRPTIILPSTSIFYEDTLLFKGVA